MPGDVIATGTLAGVGFHPQAAGFPQPATSSKSKSKSSAFSAIRGRRIGQRARESYVGSFPTSRPGQVRALRARRLAFPIRRRVFSPALNSKAIRAVCSLTCWDCYPVTTGARGCGSRSRSRKASRGCRPQALTRWLTGRDDGVKAIRWPLRQMCRLIAAGSGHGGRG